MTSPPALPPPAAGRGLPAPRRTAARRFTIDDGGASAVEFALVCAPFFVLLLYILQVGIYYMTQTALDAGVIRTADELRSSFNTAVPLMPDAAALKTKVEANAGGLVSAAGANVLAVEMRPMTSLSAAAVPISGGVADYGTATSVLALRAQTSVVVFAPGFSSLNKVTSTSLLRRQAR
ncbi:TadE/TadG family type IV pilus assembly protein [Methylobacterium sp. Leaf466]|uniref:TadE/TadG family type IV pilus assembly protein n=1 Tax=Methylobacterium sp. Leaf466 TaxID=1736386 RepID=UPI0006F37745|nr:TadE/TadG family type IV pilus assembly protein [Methylobacterium sp. Leaf466]KQT77341.1 hypothetical protein ASG59_12155 [Methylobacterium sp. Leaf466]